MFSQAVDALTHARFGLVLADVIGATAAHPQQDRWAILEHIRQLAGYTPVVIFTPHPQSDVIYPPKTAYCDRSGGEGAKRNDCKQLMQQLCPPPAEPCGAVVSVRMLVPFACLDVVSLDAQGSATQPR